MISAIVFVPDGTRRDADREHEILVRSLVWLVSAVVAGIVRDVTLAGAAELALADIADQAGCAIVEGPNEAARLHAAIGASAGRQVLLIETAFQPMETMVGELDSLARTLGRSASARLLAAPATPWQRLFPNRARTIGLLAATDLLRTPTPRDFPQLDSDLKPKLRFATRAQPVM